VEATTTPEGRQLNYQAGIHAANHALLAVTPLFLKCDPQDIETEHAFAAQVFMCFCVFWMGGWMGVCAYVCICVYACVCRADCDMLSTYIHTRTHTHTHHYHPPNPPNTHAHSLNTHTYTYIHTHTQSRPRPPRLLVYDKRPGGIGAAESLFR
jgi:hypothetical protein